MVDLGWLTLFWITVIAKDIGSNTAVFSSLEWEHWGNVATASSSHSRQSLNGFLLPCASSSSVSKKHPFSWSQFGSELRKVSLTDVQCWQLSKSLALWPNLSQVCITVSALSADFVTSQVFLHLLQQEDKETAFVSKSKKQETIGSILLQDFVDLISFCSGNFSFLSSWRHSRRWFWYDFSVNFPEPQCPAIPVFEMSTSSTFFSDVSVAGTLTRSSGPLVLSLV